MSCLELSCARTVLEILSIFLQTIDFKLKGGSIIPDESQGSRFFFSLTYENSSNLEKIVNHARIVPSAFSDR